ncbi:hypothetical protein J6590_060652, partial [Homalodisca vitripennis]
FCLLVVEWFSIEHQSEVQGLDLREYSGWRPWGVVFGALECKLNESECLFSLFISEQSGRKTTAKLTGAL